MIDENEVLGENKGTLHLELEEKIRSLEEKNKFQAEYIAGLKQSNSLLKKEIDRLKACLIRNL